jgi:hypothetical protein
MQEYVQKSMTTTLPRSPSRVRGFELSQPVAPVSAGMRPSTTGAAPPALADIIAPPAGSVGLAAIIIAPPAGSSGFALIIIAPPAGSASAAAGFALAMRFEAPATVAACFVYSAGHSVSKFRTFGRSWTLM